MTDCGRALVAMLMVCALSKPLTAAAQVVLLEPTAENVTLAKGASRQIGFTLHNTGSSAAVVMLNTHPYSMATNVYTLQAQGPCLVPTGFPFTQPLPVPIAAGARVECRYDIQRGAAAHSDTVLVFQLDANGSTTRKTFRLGDLTALQTRQLIVLPATATQDGRLRLTLRNAGPTDIARLSYSICSPGLWSTVEVLSGPCEQIGPGSCGGGTLETGLRLDALPVNAVASCDLRLRAGNQQLPPLSLALFKQGGATLVNTEPASNELRPSQVISLAPAIALPILSAPWLLLTAMALFGVGAIRRWRRSADR